MLNNYKGFVLELEILEPGQNYLPSNDIGTFLQNRFLIENSDQIIPYNYFDNSLGTKKIDNLCVNIDTTGPNGEVTSVSVNTLHRGCKYQVNDIVSIKKNEINNFCLLKITKVS